MQYNTIYFSLDALQYNIIHIARDKRKGTDKEDPEKKNVRLSSRDQLGESSASIISEKINANYKHVFIFE